MSTIKTKNIKQTVIGSTTQPMYIGGIASDNSDAKISIASDGTTTVVGNSTTSTSLNIIFDYSLGIATSTIDMSGFTLVPNAKYRLYFECDDSGDMQHIYLTINGNNTLTNYYSNSLNAPLVAYISGTYGTGFRGFTDMTIDYVGKFRTHTSQQAGNGTTMSVTSNSGFYSNFTVTSVTSFRITNYRAYNFPIGTRFKLVRIA